jgi:arylsulfatase
MQASSSRRAFLKALGGAASIALSRAQTSRNPNIIIILADDLGYGDLHCYGSRIPTPNLDRLAEEGCRLTRFYSASPVCSPSRAALLTGKYPARTGIVNVLMPNSPEGLDGSQPSLPKMLKDRGYATSCVGKWHLGNRPEYMPNRNGFDEFRGIPYSNDMWPLPFMTDSQVTVDNCDQESLTDRFADLSVDFINRRKDSPFFLYTALTAPHIPIAPAARFKGMSGLGSYGDIVTELDWAVGRIVSAVKDNGLDNNTLIVFTSDNGPWYQGSAGPLQGRKGSTYEGGVREPFIARMPGRITAGGVMSGVSSMMDLMPTIAGLCGGSKPAGVDGVDLWPMLSGERSYIERDVLLFFDGWQVQCARWGPWKLHVARYNSYAWTVDPPGGRWNLPLPRPELYNVDEDPAESYDQAPDRLEVVQSIRQRVESLMTGLPGQAQDAWRDTMARQVYDTPAGALPQQQN